MLVAKREPFELGAHDGVKAPAQHAPGTSRFTRALAIVQMLGALIAVPAGLGSAYTMYKTNYSPEATCQSLRAGIVAMFDRNVDAGTRRALVRRDVETFEQTCGAADPNATAAFKALLGVAAAPSATAARAAPPLPAPRKIETAGPVRSEPAPAPKAKPSPMRSAAAAPTPPALPAPAAAAPEEPMSDAAWLAAVRGALDNHGEQAKPAQAPPAPADTLRSLGEMTATQPLPPASPAAPALPPPASVAATPVPQVDSGDHPIPPAAIPDPPQPDPSRGPSRIGDLVSEIPFVGKSLADHITR